MTVTCTYEPPPWLTFIIQAFIFPLIAFTLYVGYKVGCILLEKGWYKEQKEENVEKKIEENKEETKEAKVNPVAPAFLIDSKADELKKSVSGIQINRAHNFSVHQIKEFYEAKESKILSNDERKRLAFDKTIQIINIVYFVFFPTICQNVLQLLYCSEIDGKRYSLHNPSLECDSFLYTKLEIFAICLGFIYIVLMPTYYIATLYQNMRILVDERYHGTAKFESLKTRYYWFYGYYKPTLWYFEFVELLKKFLLTNLYYFPQGYRIFLGMAISSIFAVLIAFYKPFVDKRDSILAVFAQILITVTLMFGYAIEAETGKAEREDADADMKQLKYFAGQSLIILNSLFFIVAFLFIFYENQMFWRDANVRKVSRKVKEGVLYRLSVLARKRVVKKKMKKIKQIRLSVITEKEEKYEMKLVGEAEQGEEDKKEKIATAKVEKPVEVQVENSSM
eukprot:g5977.t1